MCKHQYTKPPKKKTILLFSISQKENKNKNKTKSMSSNDNANTNSPNATPVLAMTKNNWIATQHYEHIADWDWQTCLAFLSLSETSQHKLPGSTLTTSKVRRLVVNRLQDLILELQCQSPQSVGLALDQDALRHVVNQLSTLLLSPPASNKDSAASSGE